MSTPTELRFKRLLKLYFVNEYFTYYGNLVVQVRLFDLLPGLIPQDEYHEKLSFIRIERPSKKTLKDINEELRKRAMENALLLKKIRKEEMR